MASPTESPFPAPVPVNGRERVELIRRAASVFQQYDPQGSKTVPMSALSAIFEELGLQHGSVEASLLMAHCQRYSGGEGREGERRASLVSYEPMLYAIETSASSDTGLHDFNEEEYWQDRCSSIQYLYRQWDCNQLSNEHFAQKLQGLLGSRINVLTNDSEFYRLTNQHRYARNLKFAHLMTGLRMDLRSQSSNALQQSPGEGPRQEEPSRARPPVLQDPDAFKYPAGYVRGAQESTPVSAGGRKHFDQHYAYAAGSPLNKGTSSPAPSPSGTNRSPSSQLTGSNMAEALGVGRTEAPSQMEFQERAPRAPRPVAQSSMAEVSGSGARAEVQGGTRTEAPLSFTFGERSRPKQMEFQEEAPSSPLPEERSLPRQMESRGMSEALGGGRLEAPSPVFPEGQSRPGQMDFQEQAPGVPQPFAQSGLQNEASATMVSSGGGGYPNATAAGGARERSQVAVADSPTAARQMLFGSPHGGQAPQQSVDGRRVSWDSGIPDTPSMTPSEAGDPDEERQMFSARNRIGHGNILSWGDDSRTITPKKQRAGRSGRQLAYDSDQGVLRSYAGSTADIFNRTH